MFSVGDKVAVLDDAINGVVISIKNSEITIETTDGFKMTFFVNELIKVNDTSILSKNIGSFNSTKIKIEKEEPKPRSFVKVKKSKNEIPAPEFDLHIEKLIDRHSHLDAVGILGIQLNAFEKFYDEALMNNLTTITVIHGVGTGKLKDEIHEILRLKKDVKSFINRYNASFGYGATEIFLKTK
jgi:dsDNA-specific endonuclease/ATPase MutS2